MESRWIIEWFQQFGPWAVLFVGLFWYVLRTSAEREERLIKERREMLAEADDREKRLIDALNELADKYNIIVRDLSEIKQHLIHGKGAREQ